MLLIDWIESLKKEIVNVKIVNAVKIMVVTLFCTRTVLLVT